MTATPPQTRAIVSGASGKHNRFMLFSSSLKLKKSAVVEGSDKSESVHGGRHAAFKSQSLRIKTIQTNTSTTKIQVSRLRFCFKRKLYF
jgi:hypothetical protein